MSGLRGADYAGYAAGRVAEAYRTIDTHATSAYTGICAGCGRPGPCDELRGAYDLVARYAPAPPQGPDPTSVALAAVAGVLDELRTTCTTIITATDQAGSRLYGTDRADARLVSFHRALTDAWAALGVVYASLHDARHLPGTPDVGAWHLLARLRAAQANAERAGRLAAAVRRRLIVAADRLHRTREASALVAARHLDAAIARLDLVAARLAVGGVALGRYAETLAERTGVPQPGSSASARAAAPPATDRVSGSAGAGDGTPVEVAAGTRVDESAEIAAGTHAAGRLIGAARRRRRPGRWIRVRHQIRTEEAQR